MIRHNSLKINEKHIIIDLQFGLSNRLRALASAYVLAKKTNRKLIVIWQPDVHCNCTFDELFTGHNLYVVDSNPFEIGDTCYYDYMNAPLRRANKLRIDHETDKDIFIRAAYTLDYSFYNKDDENEFLRLLKPVAPVLNKLKQFDISSMIGLHIRMGAGKNFDKERWDSDEFLDSTGKEFMYFWRDRSHYDAFIPLVQEILEKNPEQKFFLSADLKLIYDVFTEKFGENIIYNQRTIYDRSKKQQISALLDLYCLSKTKMIYGSAWSAFTEVASRIGGNPCKLSGIDFAIKDFEITKRYLQIRSTYEIPIVVVIDGFQVSLKKLLDSLNNAKYPQKVKLIISIDNDQNQCIEKLAQTFEWKHGDKDVIVHNDLGLNDHILFAGNLSRFYDGIILFDRELFISPYFYHYVIAAFDYYRKDLDIAGFALHSKNYYEAANLPFIPLMDGNDVFFMQSPSAMGQFWSKEQWFAFKSWHDENLSNTPTQEDGLPAHAIARSQLPCEMFYYWYMIRKNRYCVYPRFSLTCYSDDLDSPNTLYELFIHTPLLFSKRNFVFLPLSESLSVYDAYYEILPQRLAKLQPILQKYDFACDLYGLKHKAMIKERYLLSSKTSDQPLYSYVRELKPHEANIIANLSGQDVFLAESNTFVNEDNKGYLFDQLLYYFNDFHGCQIAPYPQLHKEVKALRKENELAKNHYKESESKILRLETLMQQHQETINKQNSRRQESEKLITQQQETISEQNLRIKEAEILSKQQQETINKQNSRHLESEKLITQQQETISEQNLRLKEAEMQVKQQQETIRFQNDKIHQNERIAKQQQQAINEKDVQLSEAKAQIDDFLNIIKAKDAQIASKDLQIKQMFDAISEKDTEIKSLAAIIEQTNLEKEELARTLSEKLHVVASLNSEVSAIKDELNSRSVELSASREDVSLKGSIIKSLETSIKESHATIKQLQEQVQKKTSKVNDLEDLISGVEASYTFRIGKAIVWPAKLIMGKKK